MNAFTDHDFIVRRKDAVRGSRKLCNAILKSLGYQIPRHQQRPRPVAPSFAPKVARGRPIGSLKVRVAHKELHNIQVCVARCCQVRIENLRSKRRAPRYANARHLAMYVAREATGISYPDIGIHFDRDHTTVIYGVNKVRGLIDAGNARTIKLLNAIHARLAV